MGLLGWRLAHGGDFLELVHDLDGLCKSLSCLHGLVHLNQVFIHLFKMLVDELIDDLRWQVHPNVKYAVLVLATEGLKQVFLDI